MSRDSAIPISEALPDNGEWVMAYSTEYGWGAATYRVLPIPESTRALARQCGLPEPQEGGTWDYHGPRGVHAGGSDITRWRRWPQNCDRAPLRIDELLALVAEAQERLRFHGDVEARNWCSKAEKLLRVRA